jgi:hypothetical protein
MDVGLSSYNDVPSYRRLVVPPVLPRGSELKGKGTGHCEGDETPGDCLWKSGVALRYPGNWTGFAVQYRFQSAMVCLIWSWF